VIFRVMFRRKQQMPSNDAQKQGGEENNTPPEA
jgi:hypothetical protein